MSGGRFLVSLKDTEVSEKILKIMSLIREGIDIDETIKEEKPDQSVEQSLVDNPLVSGLVIDCMQFDAKTRKVAVHVAGYIAKKLLDPTKYKFCVNYLTGELDKNNPDHDFVGSLSIGGLTIPSSHLREYVCAVFAVWSTLRVS